MWALIRGSTVHSTVFAGCGLRGGLDQATALRVDSALEAAGILDIADRSMHMLSGGQLQRALFARLIMQDAPLILLDEPFAAVDQSTEAHLLTLIDHWRTEGRAVVLVRVVDIYAIFQEHFGFDCLIRLVAVHGPHFEVIQAQE